MQLLPTLKHVGLVSLSLVFAVSTTSAEVNAVNTKVFNKDMPVSIDALPKGTLRSTLQNLPSKAQGKALKWLESFEFPEADVAYLRADKRGGIFYEDPVVDVVESTQGIETTPVLNELTQVEVFKLHSKPGASRVVYLDMDGHIVTGTIWNSTINSFDMLPYDTDGDNSSFSSAELNDISETWRRISEDFAPFDIDVTTEEPAAFGSNVGHLLISPKVDRFGNAIYDSHVGGVAYVGVWGRSNFAYYQPALVFPEGTSSSPQSMSEAGSHELGHNLGLSHDGTSTVGYYTGHGSDNTSWAPIMGVGYYSHVTQWSKGEYSDANNLQDDLAIITGHLSANSDDHENTNYANATALVKSTSTNISSTNPVTDPDNIQNNNKGIIENSLDVDLFYIDTGAGEIDLAITPAWISHYFYEVERGANLDIKASLYDEGGNLIAQDDPTNDTVAHVVASVTAGRYILAIEGVGVRTAADGYSDYGSLGQYFINGTVPDDLFYTAAPLAPSDVVASLSAATTIELTWTDLGDTAETNEVGYKVYRQKDATTPTLIANLVSNSSNFTDTNLENGSYTYYLEVFNHAGSNDSNLTEIIDITTPIITYVTAESTFKGLIESGSYADTANDSSAEVLREVDQGGRLSSEVSVLEHVWTMASIEAGEIVTLNIDAEAPSNSDGDDFEFSYSINGATYIPFGILANGSNQILTVNLPTTSYGLPLSIKVVDTDKTPGNTSADTIIVNNISLLSTIGDIAEQLPVLEITSLNNGYEIDVNFNIVFTALASDYEDGDISANISWTDGNTEIGASNTITVSSLSIGVHTINASVSDSAGNSITKSILITITDPNAPADPVAPLLSLSTNKLAAILDWTHECTSAICNDTVESSIKAKGVTTHNVASNSTLSIVESKSGTHTYKVYSDESNETNETNYVDSNRVSIRLK